MSKLDNINKKILELEEKINGKHDNGLTGALVDKYIKCGKSGCKCSQGYKHGPYPHIQYYDEDGKLKTIYIRKKQAIEYREKISQNEEYRKTIKQLIKLYKSKIKLENKKRNS